MEELLRNPEERLKGCSFMNQCTRNFLLEPFKNSSRVTSLGDD